MQKLSRVLRTPYIRFYCPTFAELFDVYLPEPAVMESNQDSLQPWSVATTASVTVLAFVTVCLRLLARYERMQKLWWDDYMVIFSMVSSTLAR